MARYFESNLVWRRALAKAIRRITSAYLGMVTDIGGKRIRKIRSTGCAHLHACKVYRITR